MNKFLLQTPNKNIYTFVVGTGWQKISTGEPTDLLFIQQGMPSIKSSDFLSLFTQENTTTLDILASKQSDSVNHEFPIQNKVDLDGGLFYKSVDLDLSKYAGVTNVTVQEV